MPDTPLHLFGGAITAVAPSNLLDASEIRQVPDTQEVLLFPDSSISIIVEIHNIFQTLSPTRFHFDSLAHDNDAVTSEVVSVNVIPNDRGDATPSIITLSGVQRVPKFNKTNPDEVRILMALYRVVSNGIDLVVTFNIPVISEDGGAVQGAKLNQAQAQFDLFSRSLRIEDFGVFV